MLSNKAKQQQDIPSRSFQPSFQSYNPHLTHYNNVASIVENNFHATTMSSSILDPQVLQQFKWLLAYKYTTMSRSSSSWAVQVFPHPLLQEFLHFYGSWIFINCMFWSSLCICETYVRFCMFVFYIFCTLASQFMFVCLIVVLA